MGRYSFFIIGFCYRSNYVYADSISSDILSDSSSNAFDSSSTSTSDSTSGALDSSSSVQQKEDESTTSNSESSEESLQSELIYSDDLKNENSYDLDNNYEEFYSPYRSFFDMFGGTIDIFYDEDGNLYEKPKMALRSMWSGSSFSGVNISGQDVGGGLGNISIGSAFSSWSWPIGTDQKIINHGILYAARNSIYATNARIDGLFDNFDSLNSRINTTNSRVSDTEISINSLKSANSTNSNNISTLFGNIGNINSSISSLKDDISVSRDNERSLSSAVTNVNNRATELSSRSDGLSSRIGNLEAANMSLSANMSQEFDWTRTVLKQIKESIDGLGPSLDAIKKNQVESTSKLVGEFGFLRSLISSEFGYTRDLLKDMKLESHLDTAVLSASVVGLHDTWKSTSYYTDILETDGNSVKLLKGQTTRLINSINSSDGFTRDLLKDIKADNNNNFTVNNQYLKALDSHMFLIRSNQEKFKDSLIADNGFTRDLLKDMKTDNNVNLGTVNQYLKALDSHMFSIRLNQQSLSDLFSVENKYTRDLLKDMKFESHLDTATIVTAIAGLHDTWKSKDYNASILDDDGDAVKLMKSVANKIGTSVANNISLLRNVFGKDGSYWTEYDKRWDNFPLFLQGLFNGYFDNVYNIENKDSLLYRLTYTIMDESSKIRDFVIEINDNLLIVNDSLLLIIDWLKMIYQKPPYSVTVATTPFNYNLLQEMLNGLNFGNVVNEAGTNMWDFLKQLVDTLGEVISTAIASMADVLGDILDFLDGLLDKIIALIVPENTDFLDTGFSSIKGKLDLKFDSFLSLGTQVKEVVQPIDSDFKQVVSIDIMGAKFNPDFSTIDWVVVRFRTVMSLSIWLSVAIYVYRKITGNGDLINDN